VETAEWVHVKERKRVDARNERDKSGSVAPRGSKAVRKEKREGNGGEELPVGKETQAKTKSERILGFQKPWEKREKKRKSPNQQKRKRIAKEKKRLSRNIDLASE